MGRWTPRALERLPPDTAGNRDVDRAMHLAGAEADAAHAVGRLPRAVVLAILDHVPLGDLPRVALASRALRDVVYDERLWELRYRRMDWESRPELPDALLDAPLPVAPAAVAAPPVAGAASSPPAGGFARDEGELGGIVSGCTLDVYGAGGASTPRAPRAPKTIDLLADLEFDAPSPALTPPLVASSGAPAQGASDTRAPYTDTPRPAAPCPPADPIARPFAARMQRASMLLTPFLASLATSPSISSSILFTTPSLAASIEGQAALLRMLVRFASPLVLGVPRPELEHVDTVQRKLVHAAGYLDTQLRSAYMAQVARRAESLAQHTAAAAHGAPPPADVQAAEAAMRSLAHCAWAMRVVAPLLRTEAEMRAAPAAEDIAARMRQTPRMDALRVAGGSVVAEVHVLGRAIFEQEVPHNPSDAVASEHGQHMLQAAPMAAFREHLAAVTADECALMMRVFPSAQGVELVFLERLVVELMADYVANLLQRAESHSQLLYLTAYSRSYEVLMPLADVVAARVPHVELGAARVTASQLWEALAEEYLDSEERWVRAALHRACEKWQHELDAALQEHRDAEHSRAPHSAAEKRSFLSKFKDALQLPAVSLPRSTSISASGSPQPARSPEHERPSRPSSRDASPARESGYFGLRDAPDTAGDDDDDDDDDYEGVCEGGRGAGVVEGGVRPAARLATPRLATPRHPSPTRTGAASPLPLPMSTMLSLETAIELINIARLALQRVDVLRVLGGALSARVQPVIERTVLQLLAALDDEHLRPGFAKAREQLGAYDPRALDAASDGMEPLVLFFELVHVADTMQQMIQVFFDQTAATMLGKTDFTNAAVREKKRLENDLDDNVAEGLNAGVELFVQHVEHIVLTQQGPRDFYPETDVALDVSQPTRACVACCDALREYCAMLATCAEKALLDVFYQEIGFRLYAVLCKHLKRQIISLSGGFQVISDLNAYYNFIVSLRQPALTSIFGALKMVGSLYIVDEPKELAKLVRDASLGRGTLRSEEMYEFLRSRCDFKTIERNIDAELFGFKVREDCVVQ
ncbi:F-box protein: endocytic membrane traffic, recycling ReCYcling 1 [Malassezia sp. CBS 17886]|nr:F-box protein: endocytic membrane traffic, recycling ReCYcling 1 [Malassezia sp. CBS 17886]